MADGGDGNDVATEDFVLAEIISSQSSPLVVKYMALQRQQLLYHMKLDSNFQTCTSQLCFIISGLSFTSKYNCLP